MHALAYGAGSSEKRVSYRLTDQHKCGIATVVGGSIPQ